MEDHLSVNGLPCININQAINNKKKCDFIGGSREGAKEACAPSANKFDPIISIVFDMT